jgi:hypothetical protein
MNKKPNYKKIVLIALPAIMIFGMYFLMQGPSEIGDGEFADSTLTNESYVSEEKKDSEKKSKLDIYDQEEQSKEDQEKLNNKTVSTVNEMFEPNSEPVDEIERSRKEIMQQHEMDLQQEEFGESKKVVKNSPNQKSNSNPKSVAVQKPKDKKQETSIQPAEERRKGFYTSFNKENENSSTPGKNGFVNAVVQQDSKVRDGQTISIRIDEDCVIGGVQIPAKTYVSGLVHFENERALVKISSVNHGGNITPITASVYDNDGVEGIYVPGNVNQEIRKDVASQGTRVTTNVPIIGSISTNVGSKKINDQTIFIPKNYKLLIKEIKE